MQAFLRLEAVIRSGRAEAIARVREAVQTGGGYITDASLFSNKALSVKFAVERASLPRLRAALAARSVVIDAESTARFDAAEARAGAGDEEILGMLYAMLVHDEPDLADEVPEVPG